MFFLKISLVGGVSVPDLATIDLSTNLSSNLSVVSSMGSDKFYTMHYGIFTYKLIIG